MSLLAAIDRADVADYVDTLVLVYVVLIFIQIIVSFIPRMPYNRFLSAFLTFVADVVNPYLNIFAASCRRCASARRAGSEPDGGHIRAPDRGRDRERPHPRRVSRAAGWTRAAATVAVVLALDQATKALAVARIDRGDSVNVFFGLDLTNARNSGVAFGALEGSATLVGC